MFVESTSVGILRECGLYDFGRRTSRQMRRQIERFGCTVGRQHRFGADAVPFGQRPFEGERFRFRIVFDDRQPFTQEIVECSVVDARRHVRTEIGPNIAVSVSVVSVSLDHRCNSL